MKNRITDNIKEKTSRLLFCGSAVCIVLLLCFFSWRKGDNRGIEIHIDAAFDEMPEKIDICLNEGFVEEWYSANPNINEYNRFDVGKRVELKNMLFRIFPKKGRMLVANRIEIASDDEVIVDFQGEQLTELLQNAGVLKQNTIKNAIETGTAGNEMFYLRLSETEIFEINKALRTFAEIQSEKDRIHNIGVSIIGLVSIFWVIYIYIFYDAFCSIFKQKNVRNLNICSGFISCVVLASSRL